MEDVPPSYDCIDPTVLELLPPYLSTSCLVALCQVSRAYYYAFISHLWGSPAAHFVQISGESGSSSGALDTRGQITGSHNDLVYVALTRFKRSLRKARLRTRQLCHTFHLPPAHSEIYGGPNASWLRDLLDWLPALQSLCVSGLPFFDHHGLMAVHKSRAPGVPPAHEHDAERSYRIKLLLAAKEPNATSVGLSLLMLRLPQLVYLDLSYTTPARDHAVLSNLSKLRDIQVLKLKGIGLRDVEVEYLAAAIGLRVRLLDVSENQITDRGLDTLLQTCCLLPSNLTTSPNGQVGDVADEIDRSWYRRHHESWPVGITPPSDFMSLDIVRTVELDDALVSQLTNPLTGRLAFEDIPHGGITHLYLSGNSDITLTGIRNVLSSGRIHVLDAGDISMIPRAGSDPSPTLEDNSSSHNSTFATGDGRHGLTLLSRRRAPVAANAPILASKLSQERDYADHHTAEQVVGAVTLIPVLKTEASANLTHIRINHTLVTSSMETSKTIRQKANRSGKNSELAGSMPLEAEVDGSGKSITEVTASSRYAVEAPTSGAIFEVDGAPSMRCELPGDPIHIALSPPLGEAPTQRADMMAVESVLSPIRGEGPYAPEVVAKELESDSEKDHATIDSTTESDSSWPALATEPNPTTVRTEKSIANTNMALAPVRQPSVTTSARLAQLEQLISKRPTSPTTLHPSMLPNLRSLTLTNVPSKVSPAAGTLIHRLRDFIRHCADEARIARLRVKTDYSLPPGRARSESENQELRKLFALRTIMLEVVEPVPPGSQRRWNKTAPRTNPFKSSTGDMDSENLWHAAEDDFSFFGEEGEEPDECGIYDNEPDKYFPTAVPDDKMLVTESSERTHHSRDYSNRDSNGITNDTNHSHSHNHSVSNGTVATAFSAEGTTSQPSPVSAISPSAGPFSPLRSAYPFSPHPLSAQTRSTFLSGPRDLPLGRPRGHSNEPHRIDGNSHIAPSSGTTANSRAELSTPQSRPAGRSGLDLQPPRRVAGTPQRKMTEPLIDVVASLAAYRRERRAAYEAEYRRVQAEYYNRTGLKKVDFDVFVEGHWEGEVKIDRIDGRKVPKGKLERTGDVDIYGNYFEGGYLYP